MKALIEHARRKAIELERMLEERLNHLVRPSPRPPEPLETRNAILHAIDDQVITGPMGAPVFPFNHVTVELLADLAPALEAQFEGDGGLAAAARAHLARRGCRVEPDALFDIATVAAPPQGWPPDAAYRLHFSRRRRSREAAGAANATTLTLVLQPGPDERVFRLTEGRLDIGRVREVRDASGQIVRRNAVCIDVEHDPGGTVSRRHAHIRAAIGPGGDSLFMLRDDASTYGTQVVRDGDTIAVHRGTAGVRLRDGDELYLGNVRGLVRIGR